MIESVSSDLLEEIEVSCRRIGEGILPPGASYRKIAEDIASPARAREEISRLLNRLGIDGNGRKLLEVGSGFGMIPAIAREEFGIDAFGIEPGEQFEGTFECSRKILREFGCPENAIRHGVGEALPFEDASFDIVYSSNVLEHVENPSAVVSEAIRVLKPGGYLCFIVPNYGSWWEGHYGVLWIPHLPKFLAKVYVRLYGRDPSLIDTLQLITRGSLEKIVNLHAQKVEVLGWGEELWEQRVRTTDFSTWALLSSLKKLVGYLHKLRAAGVIVWLGRRMHWETPLMLTLRKL